MNILYYKNTNGLKIHDGFILITGYLQHEAHERTYIETRSVEEYVTISQSSDSYIGLQFSIPCAT